MKKILFLLSFVSVFSLAQTTKGDGSLVRTSGDETWSGTIDLFGKYVVDVGHTLTILPGTVIKGRAKTTEADDASALIVARGGKLNAAGTADNPIIMTSNDDDLSGSAVAPGSWGGLIVLGKGKVNTPSGNTTRIEGIATGYNLYYGGTDDADNSGVYKYISIRNGGALLGEGNEINGFTLGGVGSGTTIDHIEVYNNADDGIEFFGGSANASNLIISNVGDDALDIDHGYSGNIDNIVIVMGPSTDHPFEISGYETGAWDQNAFGAGEGTRAHSVTDATVFSLAGETSLGRWKEAANGTYTNVFETGMATNAIIVNWTTDTAYDNFEFKTVDNNNADIDAMRNGATPASEFTLVDAATVGANSGVFGWAYTDLSASNEVTKGDGTLVRTSGDETWSGTIDLFGKYVVDVGHTLTILPGTVIKGRAKTTEADDASALIVARGGKLNAAGTADNPIIMTSNDDDLSGSAVAPGSWGGLIVLGKGKVNTPSGNTTRIEGIATGYNLYYGGTDDADNSGVYKYISIRNGGALLGEGNEINGFTLGGVGSGTTIDHIEVYNNADDGIEFFGGSANASNLIISNVGDDALDIDHGYSGNIDNIVIVMGPSTDHPFEISGYETGAWDQNAFGAGEGTRAHSVTDATVFSLAGETSLGRWKEAANGTYTNVFETGMATNAIIVNWTTDTAYDNFEFKTVDNNNADIDAMRNGATPASEFTLVDEFATVGANSGVFGWAYTNVPQNSTLSVEYIQETKAIKISLYPNPTINDFNILSDVTIQSIEIYKVTGQLVKKEIYTGANIAVDDLNKGIYLVKANTKDNSFVNKLIIK